MSGYIGYGDGTERVVIGVANPVRVRALDLLKRGELPGEKGETVQKLLSAPSIKWADWNRLVSLVKMDKVNTHD